MPYKMKGFPMLKETGAMKAMSPKKAMKDPMKAMKDPMKAMKDPMKAMSASPKKVMDESPNKKTIAKDKRNVNEEWNRLSEGKKREIIDDYNSQVNPNNPDKD